MTAKHFMDQLQSLQTKSELEKVQRYFSYEGVDSKFLGVRMADLFELAKTFIQMPLHEIELLLDSEFYEARMGAVCMMDFQAREKKYQPAKKRNYLNCIFQNTIKSTTGIWWTGLHPMW